MKCFVGCIQHLLGRAVFHAIDTKTSCYLINATAAFFPLVSATKHGLLSAPDTAGWGPIYVAVLEKVGATTFTPSALLPAAEESEDDSDGDGCALDGAQPEVGAVDEDDSS